MTAEADDLRSLLSHHLSQTEDTPTSITREHHLVDALVEAVRDWEVGDMDYSDLKSLFGTYSDELPRFDFEAWFDAAYGPDAKNETVID